MDPAAQETRHRTILGMEDTLDISPLQDRETAVHRLLTHRLGRGKITILSLRILTEPEALAL
jgi:hypothetical protein